MLYPKRAHQLEKQLLKKLFRAIHIAAGLSLIHILFEMNQTFLKGIVLKMQLRGGLRNDQVLQYIECVGTLPVSYTHLDVYKRQPRQRG